MTPKSNLNELLKEMQAELQAGEYVFTLIEKHKPIPNIDIIGQFSEKEGKTLILERSKADQLGLSYQYIASWITLNVHSALNSVGLTAAFSNALATRGISCNVIAAYHHDHIFVAIEDSEKAMNTLKALSDAHN